MGNFTDIINAINSEGEIEIPVSELESLLSNAGMDAEHIVVHLDGEKAILNRKNAEPKPTEFKHEYVFPDFFGKLRALVAAAVKGQGSGNILLSGPMGTGKSELVHELCKEFGVKCYQINGSESLIPSDFYGMMTVDVKDGASITRFERGPLYNAFLEGTKLDADGNQELDAEGNPIVVGPPAIFFLDEFAAMIPQTFLGIFNRVLEIPRDGSPKSRTMEVAADGGKVVKSHPGMMVFLAGNTVGAGNGGKFSTIYTAQGNRMDESTRSRITSSYRVGYNLKAERSLLQSAFNDDLEVERMVKFVDDLRNMYDNGSGVTTPVSTRAIVNIIRLYRMYKGEGISNPLTEAIRDSVYNMLAEADKHSWNEEVRVVYGVNFQEEDMKKKGEYRYF